MKVAIILFPGTNCELESKYVIEQSGMDCDIVRWNQISQLSKYDGYFLPGGWSYEDRIRAGVIAANGKIIKTLKEQDSQGKPIIGICNGCQILAEAGLVPNLGISEIEVALAPNRNPKISGFYCTWINIKKNNESVSIFTKDIEEIIQLPIAHAEGRFISVDEKFVQNLEKNNQIVFQYSDNQGNVIDKFPINPNGSINNIAGISNLKGNVLAMMPHPERASFYRQHKGSVGDFKNNESHAPAIQIFKSMKKYMEERK